MAKLLMEAEDTNSIDLTMMGRSMLSGNYFAYADVRDLSSLNSALFLKPEFELHLPANY